MATLRQHLDRQGNDYASVEDRYRDAGYGALVTDPLGSYARRLDTFTRSASVLIGSYNSGDSLARVLVSLEESSFNRAHPDLLEVIVVDDGSTDGTSDVVPRLGLDLNVRLLRQQHAGLTTAHNTALSFATGDIVVFLDADVVLTPWALEEMMKRHELCDSVTLIGFRFELEATSPQLADGRLRDELARMVPAFFRDFRLSFPGRPENICGETDHLKRFGHGSRLQMANGAAYDLPAMVVGAFFSLSRADLSLMGGSDERLSGWGCEDSVIGARSIALGNVVVPVYSASGAHISHSPRRPAEGAEFARNIQTAQAILDEELCARELDVERCRSRVEAEWSCHASGCRMPRPPPETYPVAADQYPELGACLYALGRFGEAADVYERWQHSEPASPWPQLGHAKSLASLGAHDQALRVLASLLDRHPDHPAARFELGLAHAALGDFEAARGEFERARELSPSWFEPAWVLGNSSEEHKRRGNHHAGQGFHQIAVRDFELALTVDPHSPWAEFDRGSSLLLLGNLEAALGALDRAAALLHPEDGNRTWLHSTLAQLHFERADYGRARLELERALRLSPENRHARSLSSRLAAAASSSLPRCPLPRLVDLVDGVPGWLTSGEIELLGAAALAATEIRAPGQRSAIIELGSFCGRSTIAIAAVLRSVGDAALPFFSVDPHEGYHYGGGIDTEPVLVGNLERRGLADQVNVIRARSNELDWTLPLSLLFIDALHDYDNVRRDYEHFVSFLIPGALVAFHDYAAYCPGVQRCVDELLESGELGFVAESDSLMLLCHRRGSPTATKAAPGHCRTSASATRA